MCDQFQLLFVFSNLVGFFFSLVDGVVLLKLFFMPDSKIRCMELTFLQESFTGYSGIEMSPAFGWIRNSPNALKFECFIPNKIYHFCGCFVFVYFHTVQYIYMYIRIDSYMQHDWAEIFFLLKQLWDLKVEIVAMETRALYDSGKNFGIVFHLPSSLTLDLDDYQKLNFYARYHSNFLTVLWKRNI